LANARIKESLLNEIKRSDIEYIIEQYIRDEDDRYMFSRYYIDGIAYEDIGQEMEPVLTRQAVSRRINKHLKVVMKHIYNIK